VETKKITLFELDPDKFNCNYKVKEGPRRMKLYIKMNKAETDQWAALKEAAKPPEMSDNDFARFLFMRGIGAFMEELTERINSMSDEEKETLLSDAGVTTEDEKKTQDREELEDYGKKMMEEVKSSSDD